MPLVGLYKKLLNKLLAIYQLLEEDIFEEDFSLDKEPLLQLFYIKIIS